MVGVGTLDWRGAQMPERNPAERLVVVESPTVLSGGKRDITAERPGDQHGGIEYVRRRQLKNLSTQRHRVTSTTSDHVECCNHSSGATNTTPASC